MQSETAISSPRHVAIIMDGNGRWANARGLPRTAGHRAGVERVREAVRSAAEAGVEYLTLFAFSSENWNRPKQEVSDLMGLLRFFIRKDLAELHRENVRVKVIGCRESIQPDIRALIEDAEMIAALDRGQLAGVALDVFDQEPLPTDNPLWDHPKIRVTAHTSFGGDGTRLRWDELFFDNLEYRRKI